MNKFVVSFFKISYNLLHFKNISTGGEARTPRHPVLETGALPTELLPYLYIISSRCNKGTD